ncbi:RTA1 like domain-containing protein [Trichoderma sp. SZMC 28015]
MAFENYKPSLDDPNAWVPYRYYPSVPAAAVFIALYSIVTIAHIAIIVTRRTWSFTPFIIGGLFELVGYIGRVISAGDIWAVGPYIVQSILLLVAPALFAASIYKILGQIMVFVNGAQFSLVPRRWLTKVFVAGDVVSFLLQMAGGGIQAAGTLDFLNLGEKIIIAGLFAQIAFFGFFIVVAITFQVRFTRHQGVLSLRLAKWKKHMHALYVGSLLIMVRSIFRVVEYLMGNNGFLLRHEYLLYIFDATLMFLVMILFLWVHPSQLKSSPSSEESSYTLVIGANNTLKHKGSSPHPSHRV